MPRPGSPIIPLLNLTSGPGHPVAGTLAEGDEIGGLRVIEAPGHTPGHLASARKLAALEPETVCFGHGPPLTGGEAFQRFVAGLPEA
jgi:glyoxylase-like metal-dependent hydrolase (beta-lactamase superfamily II)